MRIRVILRIASCASVLVVGGTSHAAEDVAAFYQGKTLTMLVGGGAGYSYDLAARLLTRHFGRHIPGNPSFIVKNLPGFGSVKAANQIFSVLPQDGSVIGAVLNSLPLNQALGRFKTDLDVTKMQWIGNASRETFVMVVRSDAPATTLAGIRKIEIIMGAPSRAALSFIYPTMMNGLLGTKLRVVLGYKSFAALNAALMRGEVQGTAGSPWYGLHGTAGYSERVRKGVLKVVMQFGSRKASDLPHVPLFKDLGKTADDTRLLELFSSPAEFGKPTLVGPGVPVARVQALRKAFLETTADPAFRAEAKKLGIPVSPVSGDKLQKLAQRVVSTPPALMARAKAILNKK